MSTTAQASIILIMGTMGRYILTLYLVPDCMCGRDAASICEASALE
jgi:hypothetical protein